MSEYCECGCDIDYHCQGKSKKECLSSCGCKKFKKKEVVRG